MRTCVSVYIIIIIIIIIIILIIIVNLEKRSKKDSVLLLNCFAFNQYHA